ncbi:MAG: 50S ribosomal protein L29 [Candidatus Liptonbacteria bacterium]|nr:50S ribosomal protein L29 [Candidatus Liptonbacteria bacterium]
MKKRELQDLRNKPQAELAKLLQEKRERLRVLRFDLAAQRVKNVREIYTVRKDIARIATLLASHD